MLESNLGFKTERQEQEFWSERVDHRIRLLLLDVAAYCELKDLPPPVVTEILRSDKEQRALYLHTPHRRSLHQVGRAVDLRTEVDGKSHWTQERVELVMAYLRIRWGESLRELLHHAVPGGAPHLHVAVA